MYLQHSLAFDCSYAILCDTTHFYESIQVSPYGVYRFFHLHQFLLDNVSFCNKKNNSMYL